MQECSIRVEISGRYLVDTPEGKGPFPTLVGFHGYGQRAEEQMELLGGIPGSEGWLRCSVEALHPFMNPRGDAGACWMTPRNRDMAIAENVAYVDRVIGAVMQDCPAGQPLVLLGFSQGAGMACRAALLGRHTAAGVMLLGGDIPPELDGLDRMRRVQLSRGDGDRYYAGKAMLRDAERLRAAGLVPDVVTYAGGHWAAPAWFAGAGRFLGGFLQGRRA